MTILFPTRRAPLAQTTPAPAPKTAPLPAPAARPSAIRDGISLADPAHASKLQLDAFAASKKFDLARRMEELTEGEFEFPELPTLTAEEATEARLDAEAIWLDEGGTKEFSDGVEHEVLSNPVEVSTDRGEAKAAQEVKDNQAAVEEYLAAHPELAEVYADTQALLEGDAHAQLAMQLLLLEGTLTAEPLSADGQNLAQTIAGLLEQPLAEGIDRAELVGDLVREIAVPASINQHSDPTCAATAPQIMMAQDAPAEYARLMAGLASESGEVQLANGDTIAREDGAIAGVKDNGDTDKRAITGRLWQPTMMEYANGEDLDYTYGDSRHSDDPVGDPSGLTSVEFDRLYDGLMGADTTRHDANDADSQAEVMDTIEEAVANGQSVPVGIKWNTGGHKVLVTDVRDGYVYFLNPHGTEERMTVEAFEARLRNAHVRPEEMDFAA